MRPPEAGGRHPASDSGYKTGLHDAILRCDTLLWGVLQQSRAEFLSDIVFIDEEL